MASGMKKKKLVISAINFNEGGPLTILREATTTALATLGSEWELIILVHRNQLLLDLPVQCIEFPKSKKSWGLRLYYEWHFFKKLSKALNADLWLSLHDITPRVLARRQAVYCHNPSPFYRISWAEARLEPTFFLFNQFYRYLYQALIGRNRFVVVQQAWLRDQFKQLFGAHLDVVVAHPQVSISCLEPAEQPRSTNFVFLYPALPRVFKNLEVIGAAVEILQQRGCTNFEVRLTASGEENPYAQGLLKQFGHLAELKFIGRQNSSQMAEQYQTASTVLFPSKLETWGLPISEAKAYNKPLLAADLPYAHETVGTYDKVSFFDPMDARTLADLMQALIEHRWVSSGNEAVRPTAPYAENWPELWAILTEGL